MPGTAAAAAAARKRGRDASPVPASAAAAAAAAVAPVALAPELPIARVRKLMRSDPVLAAANHHASIFTADAPAVMTRAAELFIATLTRDAWRQTAGSGRRTLLRPDVTAAVRAGEAYDFLVDVLPPGDTATAVAEAVLLAPPAAGRGGSSGSSGGGHLGGPAVAR